MIDEIDGALGEGKGAVEVILKMVIGSFICNFGFDEKFLAMPHRVSR